VQSRMSRKGRKRSGDGVLILKDYLREKYPETYEWLYGKPHKRSASRSRTSSTD